MFHRCLFTFALILRWWLNSDTLVGKIFEDVDTSGDQVIGFDEFVFAHAKLGSSILAVRDNPAALCSKKPASYACMIVFIILHPAQDAAR